MSFPNFQKNIEKRVNPEEDVISCALFLRDQAPQDTKVWQTFTARFFKEYRSVILTYFGLEQEVVAQPRIRLNNREMFLAVVAALADREVFDCEKKTLAGVLYDRFELNLKFTSLVQYICQSNSENDDILHSLTTGKK